MGLSVSTVVSGHVCFNGSGIFFRIDEVTDHSKKYFILSSIYDGTMEHLKTSENFEEVMDAFFQKIKGAITEYNETMVLIKSLNK